MSDIKALIFDVDGVLVTGRPSDGRRWDEDLKVDLGIDPAELAEKFFKPYWQDIQLGRVDMEARLGPVLEDIAPHVSADRLVDYWFMADARLETGLLSQIDRLRTGTGLGAHLATNQEHGRAQYLWRDLGLGQKFDRLFYSADLGLAKPDQAFYRHIQDELNLEPAQILFFDDQPKNVEAARQAGWQTSHWTHPGTFEQTVAELSL